MESVSEAKADQSIPKPVLFPIMLVVTLLFFLFCSVGLALTYRPDGQELAVATLNGEISFWNPQTATQTGSVAGRHDLETGRKETDKITAKQLAKGK